MKIITANITSFLEKGFNVFINDNALKDKIIKDKTTPGLWYVGMIYSNKEAFISACKQIKIIQEALDSIIYISWFDRFNEFTEEELSKLFENSVYIVRPVAGEVLLDSKPKIKTDYYKYKVNFIYNLALVEQIKINIDSIYKSWNPETKCWLFTSKGMNGFVNILVKKYNQRFRFLNIKYAINCSGDQIYPSNWSTVTLDIKY